MSARIQVVLPGRYFINLRSCVYPWGRVVRLQASTVRVTCNYTCETLSSDPGLQEEFNIQQALVGAAPL